jgi:hypothetical protein
MKKLGYFLLGLLALLPVILFSLASFFQEMMYEAFN